MLFAFLSFYINKKALQLQGFKVVFTFQNKGIYNEYKNIKYFLEMITFDNFFISTYALFKICKTPKRKADYTSYSKWGAVSSQYWYGEDKKGKFVIRKSNHWVFRKTNDEQKKEQDCKMIASCNWQLLIPKFSNYDNDKSSVTGKCYLSKFTKLA